MTPTIERLPAAGAGIVVDGDPLRDIALFRDRARPRVVKGGRFVTRNV